MKKLFAQLKITLSFLILAGLLISFSGCGSSGSATQALWTFMVYMDGDNNLESFAEADFNEMKAVGSNTQVNIAVQYDADSAFTGTKRYYVKKDGADLIQELAEQDMADPAVLTDFINWAVGRYPAQHYVLVLWNHGGGWKDKKFPNPLKGIISDDSSGNMMTISQLGSALAAAGKTFDIIGCDACLMAELEVAYQVKSYGSYLVASEQTEPGNGWPYTPILTALTVNPSMTAAQLGTQIVNDYIANTSVGSGITMSATDLSKIEALANAVNDFGQAMVASTHSSEINSAKNNVQTYEYDFLADLYHFAHLISQINEDNLAAKANAVKTALTNAVIANQKSGTAVANSNGLTIYIPTVSNPFDSDYDNLTFPQQKTNWKSFITHAFDSPPVIGTVSQSPNPLAVNVAGRLLVPVSDADGASDISRVWTYFNSSPTATGDLNDNGTGYDEVAGDGVFTIGVQINAGTIRPEIKNGLLYLPADYLKATGSAPMTIKAKDSADQEDSASYNLIYSY